MPPSLLILLFLQAAYFNVPSFGIEITSLLIEQSRAFSLLFSALNCLSKTDEATAALLEINQNFSPKDHLDEYENRLVVELLIQHVKDNEPLLPDLVTDPLTFTPESNTEMLLILGALLPNTGNWPLFYNTSAWLIDRVNSGRLYYALSVIAAEKYSFTTVTPTSVEVFPQWFINKTDIACLAGITVLESGTDNHPLHYYLADPYLNEFRWNWHVDNPFFLDESDDPFCIFPKRDRNGELFFFMHRQLLSRYNAERVANDLPYVTELELEPNYFIPEPFDPDIINVNYLEYPARLPWTPMGFYDDEAKTGLSNMASWFDNMEQAIIQGYLIQDWDGSPISLKFENASDILGSVVRSSIPSPSEELYGALYDHLHRFLAGMFIPNGLGIIPSPGVQANTATSLRDPVFFEMHKKLDKLYMDLKSRDYEPYTEQDLHYLNFEVDFVTVWKDGDQDIMDPPHILTTFFENVTFDISTAARPCVGGSPALTEVKTLQHIDFNYFISIQSSYPTRSYGMVRIFLLPVYGCQGRVLSVEESNQNAILLDVFRVEFEAWEYKPISRSSKDSSVTRMPLPGIKDLHNLGTASQGDLLQVGNTRACGFPNNLLIPKGTEEGMEYKLFVMISEEPQPPLHFPGGFYHDPELVHYPYCGMLQGLKYPDERSMGYPFDRPGTRFDLPGGDRPVYGNVRTLPVIITHQE